MFGKLKRLFETRDPDAMLRAALNEGQEGVSWVARPIPDAIDLSELNEAERAQVTFADEDAFLAHANTWGPKAFAKGGPLPESEALTHIAYDPETAELRVATATGAEHRLTAYWIANLQPNRNFADRQEVVWSVAQTPARGKGMRPALVARAYADVNTHPSLMAHDRIGDAKTALPYCFAAGTFIGLDDVLALAESATLTRYYLIDATALGEIIP